jgi:hypothetical protein
MQRNGYGFIIMTGHTKLMAAHIYFKCINY